MQQTSRMNAFAAQVFGTPGYSTEVGLEPDELRTFLGEVERQWVARLEGIAPSVAYRRGKLASLLKEFGAAGTLPEKQSAKRWQAIRDVAPLAARPERCLWRLSVAPTEAPRVAAQIAAGIDARWFYDWGGGLVWLDIPSTDDAGAAMVRGAVAQGHATLVRAPDPTRLAVPVFQPQEAALAALAARIKQAFDPAQILNPGRMYRGV